MFRVYVNLTLKKINSRGDINAKYTEVYKIVSLIELEYHTRAGKETALAVATVSEKESPP